MDLDQTTTQGVLNQNGAFSFLDFRKRAHCIPADLDFNDVLDQLYLSIEENLLAIFSNFKINGSPERVDVTRRIKMETMENWPVHVAKKLYEILVNFGISEFHKILELIRGENMNTDQYDCYKIGRNYKDISLPVHSHVYLITEELSLKQKIFSLKKESPRSALLVFRKTNTFEHEMRKVSSVLQGKIYIKEEIDRAAITSYDKMAKEFEKNIASSPQNTGTEQSKIEQDGAEKQTEQGGTEKQTEQESTQKKMPPKSNDLVVQLLTGEKKISYLSPEQQNEVIEFLVAQKESEEILPREEKLLELLSAYRH